jgi:RNA polymerase sigma-70 factor (ECF subfamily)
MDESELARLAARGDQEAFGELVRRHQSGVFNVAYRLLGERREAEDAAQEAFLRAFRSIRSLDPSRSAGPWLKKITVNVCLNRLERREPLPLEEEDDLPEPEPGPEPRALERERGRDIRRAILGLPPRYRAAIELRHFQELSYAEMAEALGCRLSDIKSDLFRARKLLAKYLLEMEQ